MQVFPDSFRLAEAPQALVRAFIENEDQTFGHLGQARIACIFSERALFLHGGQKAAVVSPINIQGTHRHCWEFLLTQFTAELFEWEPPDFLIYFDRAVWDALEPIGRERLVFHELRHIQPRETEDGIPRLDSEGRVMLRTVPHDTEIFNDEVARYGVEVCGIEETAIAIAESARRQRTKKAG